MGRARFVVMVLTLVGCGRSSASDGDSTSCTDTKNESGLTVALTTSPCPIKGGESATARVAIKDDDGAPVKDASVRLSTDMPSMNMHGGDHDMTPRGDEYEATVVLGMGGAWTLKVEVARGSTDPTAVTFDLVAE
jgi:nitrogen fixation protein FixH